MDRYVAVCSIRPTCGSQRGHTDELSGQSARTQYELRIACHIILPNGGRLLAVWLLMFYRMDQLIVDIRLNSNSHAVDHT
jgi:hypothetical protein